MKTRGLKIGKIVPAIMLLFSITFLAAPKTTNAQVQVSFQIFYDQLSPYGQWFQDPQYGYVWCPNVGPNFRPYYSNGYWAMTQYGNMWMSDYDWGWAPFHYGRWTFNPRYGWLWIPGMEWGPAWVVWRHGAGNYGWAPMGPGISVNMSFGNNYYAPYDWWTFIPMNYIYHRNFHTYYAPRNTVNIYNRTTVINNTYIDRSTRTTYVTGPRRAEVERATRTRVEVYNVGTRRDAGRADVNGRNVNIYRPRVSDNGARGSASPRNATKMERSIVTTPARTTTPNRNGTNSNLRNNNAVRPNNRNTDAQRNNNTTVPNRTTITPNRTTEPQKKVTPNRNSIQNERNVKPQNNNQRNNTTQPRIQSRDEVNRQQRVTPQQNNRSNAQPRSSNTNSQNRNFSQSKSTTKQLSNNATVNRSSNTQSRRSSMSNNQSRNNRSSVNASSSSTNRSSSVSNNNTTSRSSSSNASSRSQSRGR